MRHACPRGGAGRRCGDRAAAFIARRGRGLRRSMRSCDTSRPSALPARHACSGWTATAGRSSASSTARCWRTPRGSRADRRHGPGGHSPRNASWRRPVCSARCTTRRDRSCHRRTPSGASTRARRWVVDEIVCHGDVGPHNTVYRRGLPVAFIDWDMIRPNDPLVEFGNAAWHFVPLGNDAYFGESGFRDPPDLSDRLARFARVRRDGSSRRGVGAAPGQAAERRSGEVLAGLARGRRRRATTDRE